MERNRVGEAHRSFSLFLLISLSILNPQTELFLSKAKLLNGISNSTYQPSESKLVSQSQIVSHVKSGRLPALTTPSAFPPPPATPK